MKQTMRRIAQARDKNNWRKRRVLDQANMIFIATAKIFSLVHIALFNKKLSTQKF